MVVVTGLEMEQVEIETYSEFAGCTCRKRTGTRRKGAYSPYHKIQRQEWCELKPVIAIRCKESLW